MPTTPAPQNNNPNIASIRDGLEKMTTQFAMVMPQEVVERFKRVFVTMLNENPDLLKCTPHSLLRCAMRAAQDGLDLDGREAACVPFRDGGDMIAQYVPMVLGIRKKVRNTGMVNDWMVHVVYEGDEFDIGFGDRPYVHHKPSMKGGRTRPVKGVYSIATFKDGTKSYEFMNVDEIEDVRSKSKSRGGPWSDKIFYPEMCRKTVARLHAKQLPQSSDLVAMFNREDDDDALPPPVTMPPPRINSVSSAFDEFGAGFAPKELPTPNDRPPTQGPGEDAGPPYEPADPAGEPRDSSLSMDEARQSSTNGDGDRVATAYRRGIEQKAQGHQRKALPTEYRGSDRTKEALAWYAGHDGQPMPGQDHDRIG